MKSDIYFTTARTLSHEESMSKFKGPLALKKIGIEEKIKKGEKVVIKTHFGALENTRYLRPNYLRFLCDYVKDIGAVPFLAESCGWGVPEEISGAHTEFSGRATEKEYLDVALKHGFTQETMGASIIMLDGPIGVDYNIQNVNGKKFSEVLVAGRLREFDYMVLATHFKGHFGAGFGGAIKNLGIGCVSKGGKVEAHTGKKFDIKFELCKEDCDNCIRICPAKALIKNEKNQLKFDKERCSYCYMCASVCKNGVIDIGESTSEEFLIQMVDNAKGVVEYFGADKIFYLNYAIDITYQCDCCGGSDTPIVSDIGILSSRDPVALDQACVDLVHQSLMNPYSVLGEVKNLSKNEKAEWFSYLPRFDPESGKIDLNQDGVISKNWELQLKLAEEIGLGTRSYNLTEIKVEKKK